MATTIATRSACCSSLPMAMLSISTMPRLGQPYCPKLDFDDPVQPARMILPNTDELDSRLNALTSRTPTTGFHGVLPLLPLPDDEPDGAAAGAEGVAYALAHARIATAPRTEAMRAMATP